MVNAEGQEMKPRLKRWQRLLIVIGGGKLHLIENHPESWARYQILGGLLILVPLLSSSISAYIFLHFVKNPEFGREEIEFDPALAVLALVWGVIIHLIDRAIVVGLDEDWQRQKRKGRTIPIGQILLSLFPEIPILLGKGGEVRSQTPRTSTSLRTTRTAQTFTSPPQENTGEESSQESNADWEDFLASDTPQEEDFFDSNNTESSTSSEEGFSTTETNQASENPGIFSDATDSIDNEQERQRFRFFNNFLLYFFTFLLRLGVLVVLISLFASGPILLLAYGIKWVFNVEIRSAVLGLLIFSVLFGIAWRLVENFGFQVLVRIAFAGMIGMVIAVPLELRIFQKEIEEAIRKEKVADVKRYQDTLTTEVDSLINAKIKLKQDLEKQFLKKEKEILDKKKEFEMEVKGMMGTLRKGYGPRAKKLDQAIRKLEATKSKLEDKLNRLQETIDSLNNKRNSIVRNKIEEHQKIIMKGGIGERIEALFTKVPWYAHWGLSTLLMLLELLVVVIKLTFPPDTYTTELKGKMKSRIATIQTSYEHLGKIQNPLSYLHDEIEEVYHREKRAFLDAYRNSIYQQANWIEESTRTRINAERQRLREDITWENQQRQNFYRNLSSQLAGTWEEVSSENGKVLWIFSNHHSEKSSAYRKFVRVINGEEEEGSFTINWFWKPDGADIQMTIIAHRNGLPHYDKSQGEVQSEEYLIVPSANLNDIFLYRKNNQGDATLMKPIHLRRKA